MNRAFHRLIEPLQRSNSFILREFLSFKWFHLKGTRASKLHLCVEARGLPMTIIISDGNTADCTKAETLIDDISAGYLMADKAYDTNALLEQLDERDIEPVIPPKSHRKHQRDYDKELYKLRL